MHFTIFLLCIWSCCVNNIEINLHEMFIELLHSVFTRIISFIVDYIDGRIKQEKQIFVLYFFSERALDQTASNIFLKVWCVCSILCEKR